MPRTLQTHLTAVAITSATCLQASKGKSGQLQDVPLTHQEDEEPQQEELPSQEDYEFVQQHAGRLGFLANLDKGAMDK
jgi:hypothetical protein